MEGSYTHAPNPPHTHTASIPSLRTLLPVLLVKSCFYLAKYSWCRYSEWKEAVQLKKQQESEATKQQQDEESDKEEVVEEKITEEKHVRRRSGRRSNQNQNHVRPNQTCQNDQLDTQDEVYESGGYEDQLEAIMNDLEDDSFESKSKKLPKIPPPHEQNDKTNSEAPPSSKAPSKTNSEAPPSRIKQTKTVENIGTNDRKMSEKASKSERDSLATISSAANNTEDQLRYVH